MALTVTVVERERRGRRLHTVVDITPDSDWATGGESLTKEQFGFGSEVTFMYLPPTVAGYVPEYDYDNEKLLIYFGDYTQASDLPLTEADGEDLSSNPFRVVAEGY